MKGTNDLEIAKMRLEENDLRLCIVKCKQAIFETRAPRIVGFLEAIERFKEKLDGASVADRVVGKAIALLCVYSKIRAVYASTLGREAKTVLEKNAICIRWNNLVDNILSDDKAEMCVFEKMLTETTNPKDGYLKLKELQDFSVMDDV